MFTDKQHPKLTPFSSYKKAVKTMLTVFLFLVSFGVHAGASICSGIVGNLITNCGFETGDFSNWSTTQSPVVYTNNSSYPAYVNTVLNTWRDHFSPATR